MNQRMKTPQEGRPALNLTDTGWDCGAHRDDVVVAGTRWPVCQFGYRGHGECLRRSRGDAAGAQLGTSLLKGRKVNVGTILVVPPARTASARGGKIRCRSMRSGWDGGVVVVRAQESCVHGEGPQWYTQPLKRSWSRW